MEPAAPRLRSLSPAMIRTVWFYLMLVVSSFVHAATVIVAALVGVKRRPGGRGIYDWGTTDWARDLLDAAGAPGTGEGLLRLPPAAAAGITAEHYMILGHRPPGP